MKTVTLMLATGFLFLSFSSYSQVKTDLKNSNQYPKPPVVTKGYYSIGKNAGKLSRSSSLNTIIAESYPAIQKGYYSIGDNNRKLGHQLLVGLDRKPSIPVTTKGYYSIGRNIEKLEQ